MGQAGFSWSPRISYSRCGACESPVAVGSATVPLVGIAVLFLLAVVTHLHPRLVSFLNVKFFFLRQTVFLGSAYGG